MDIGTPVFRDEIEIRESRLSLHCNTTDFGEPPYEDLGRDRVAVSNEDVGSAPSLCTVPVLADERDRASVLVTFHETQNSF